MPKSTVRSADGPTASKVEQRDADDVEVLLAERGQADEGGGEGVFSVVKMKLATFCKNPGLHKSIDRLVLDMNRLLGEAYAFANYHVIRVLRATGADATMPRMDRNFFY